MRYEWRKLGQSIGVDEEIFVVEIKENLGHIRIFCFMFKFFHVKPASNFWMLFVAFICIATNNAMRNEARADTKTKFWIN